MYCTPEPIGLKQLLVTVTRVQQEFSPRYTDRTRIPIRCFQKSFSTAFYFWSMTAGSSPLLSCYIEPSFNLNSGAYLWGGCLISCEVFSLPPVTLYWTFSSVFLCYSPRFRSTGKPSNSRFLTDYQKILLKIRLKQLCFFFLLNRCWSCSFSRCKFVVNIDVSTGRICRTRARPTGWKILF